MVVPFVAVDVSPDSNSIPYAMINLIISCTSITVDLLIVDDVYRRVMIGCIPNCIASNIIYIIAFGCLFFIRLLVVLLLVSSLPEVLHLVAAAAFDDLPCSKAMTLWNGSSGIEIN